MSLSLAIKLAKGNPIKGKGRTSISRFAAVLQYRYRTFVGFNSYKSHPLQAEFAAKVGTPEKIHIHAEIAAIVKALNQDPKFLMINSNIARLYVARVLANGTPACARPCPGCLAAIAEFGIKHVEWTE